MADCITKLGTAIQKLEDKPALSASDQLMITRHEQKLAGYHDRFKELHDEVLEVLTDDADLETEQAVLEDHEETVVGLEEQLQILSAPVKRPDQAEKSRVEDSNQLHKRLIYMERGLDKVRDPIATMIPRVGVDLSALEAYEERLSGVKSELLDVT